MPVDTLGVVEALRGAPEQLAAAHEAAAAVLDAGRLPDRALVNHIVCCGMGGSGVVGDVVAAVGSATLPVPMVVRKQYDLPGFVGPRSLVVAVSCSGDTEETVAMATAAADAGAQLVTVASGGALEAIGRTRGVCHFPVTASVPGPRFALGAMVAPVVVTLFKMGMLPEAHAGLVRAQEQLARRRDECVPEVEGTKNPARELARRIDRTIPLVYGRGAIGAVAALRWKQSVNENAKAPGFANAYPELDHNEICGWGQHGDVTRQVVSLVELDHGMEDARLAVRAAATREQVEEAVAQILTVEAAGEGPLAQLLDLIHVGDWASVYLAMQNDVDPGPIDAIRRLKDTLAAHAATAG